jgi:hypothetical protein
MSGILRHKWKLGQIIRASPSTSAILDGCTPLLMKEGEKV